MSKSKDPRCLEGQKIWLPRRNPLHDRSLFFISLPASRTNKKPSRQIFVRLNSRASKNPSYSKET